MAETVRQRATVHGADLDKTAAALLRMQAHTLAVQGELLLEMSETLRGQADRVEHGGELPDLHVVEEPVEADRVLPRLKWVTLDTFEAEGGATERWVAEFLERFHRRWLAQREFVAVFNRVAAGKAPSGDTAQLVVAELAGIDG